MFESAKCILIKSVSPVHAGTGRTLGLIDMPIQKEKHTGIPKIEGSTFKGCMRDAYRINGKDNISKLFGPENGDDSAGVLGFTDAKLLFYPIICLDSIFAYVTCPYLINRYIEDMKLFEDEVTCKNFGAIDEGKCILLNEIVENTDKNTDKKIDKRKIILDQYFFEFDEEYEHDDNGLIKEIIGKLDLSNSRYIVAISDDDFMELIELSKEIITRNRIDHETGVVDKKTGSLFTEEYLPAESILYSLILKNGIKDEDNLYDSYLEEVKANFNFIQVGGNSTIGKGIVKIKVFEKEVK